MNFVRALPQCVTHLRLSFEDDEFDEINNSCIDANAFLKKLQRRCPNLEVLVFDHARFKAKSSCPSVAYLCEKYFSNIRVLVLHHCYLRKYLMVYDDDKALSKIEVLDISDSAFDFGQLCNRSLIYKIPHVKKLRLCEGLENDEMFLRDPFEISHLEILDLELNPIASKTFREIRKYGRNLVELYLCHTYLNDEDLTFKDPAETFPCLKIICLRDCNVTVRGIHSLIQSHPSLQQVIVSKHVVTDSRSTLGYDISSFAKISPSEKLKFCYHFAKIDYMNE